MLPLASKQSSRLDGKSAAAAALTLLGSLACYLAIPLITRHHGAPDPEQFLTRTYEIRVVVIMCAAWLLSYVLYPFTTRRVMQLRGRWRPAYTAISLALACAFIAFFIVHYGNREYGLWDFGIVIDSGWRQVIGQHPYSDFLTTAPPGFNLGIKYAFQIFGVSWDAQLIATALFGCITFLWMYWLLTRLTTNRIAAFAASFTITSAISLELCFWWFNSVTETLMLLFFLSCLLLCRQTASTATLLSYYFSLWPLALMKPNMAGTMGLCGIVLTLILSDRKLRVALATLAAAATTPLVLYLNGISIPAMFANYHSAAIERGLTLIGFEPYHPRWKLVLLFFWMLALALPIATILPESASLLRLRRWSRFGSLLFFPVLFLITFYGLTTNSELVDVQLCALLLGGILILFGPDLGIGPTTSPFARRRISLRRIYVPLLFTMLASDLYAGVMRWRVQGIGPGLFFEWRDSDHRVETGFFRDLHASVDMTRTTAQIQQAVAANSGPVFFGPRLEVGYALSRRSHAARLGTRHFLCAQRPKPAHQGLAAAPLQHFDFSERRLHVLPARFPRSNQV
jgi:hypothetical protein